MFTEKAETRLEILDNGIINVTIVKYYFKDGMQIGMDNWGCCLEPTPIHLMHAETFLDEYHMNIVRATWSEKIMTEFAKSLAL